MATGRTTPRLSQLWQLPFLVVSLGLFAVAGYFFINPRKAPTPDDKIAVARAYLKQDRPDAAIEQLNRILEQGGLGTLQEALVHVTLGEALEAGQTHLKISVPENYRRIIEQTQMAINSGIVADAPMQRRLADSYAALGETAAAVNHYREAIKLDPQHALDLRRKMIDLQLADDEPDAAAESIEDYLKQADLTAAERSWALGRKADLLVDKHLFAAARDVLAQALKLNTDPVEQGQFNYQLGYCAWKEGDNDQAERYLRLARDQMKPSHPLDGDAAYVLGRIFQDRNDPRMAASFYQVTLVSHPDSRQEPLARMGRGICRIILGDIDAGMTDLHDLAAQLARPQWHGAIKTQAIEGLKQAAALLVGKENDQAALEALTYEQQLEVAPPPGFYQRLGDVYDKRADQIQKSIAQASGAEQIRRGEQVRDNRARAGDAYVAYSRSLTMIDDKGYGDALWHGIDLYDSAGDLQRVISALELFVAERPQDKLAPDALLRLGRAYQAAGLFDKAVTAFQRNQFRYPNSLAASKSAVPLAEAYISRGPQDYPRAERVLLSVVEDNPLVDPSAEEFHQSLFELAQLYYRTQRYEEAIARLEETVRRYPNDPRLPQLTFLMADSYRKSADLLGVRLASAGPGAAAAADVISAKRQRLAKSRELFDKVLDLYAAAPPSGEVDKLYKKLSNFYRADCMYDLGRYEEAIKLYDQAAFRYQDDAAALAAYVQIVNSYCALGRTDDARTANERAKWILRRMPPEAFQDGSFSMPKKYWDDWLKWTSESGVF